MARIRTVKPSIWGDDRFSQLSRDARLLALGIISTADDSGRFIAAPVALSGTVFPLDDLKPALVKRWRDEIAAVGMIVLYKVGPREYGYIPKWRKHQRIDRPQASSLPAPPIAPDDSPPEPPRGHDPFDESLVDPFDESFDDNGANRSRGEWKGRDKERNGYPLTPASGGRSCTRHGRPRSGCTACETPANPTVAIGPQCGQCSPSRRLEDDQGNDLGPCPNCHPGRRTA